MEKARRELQAVERAIRHAEEGDFPGEAYAAAEDHLHGGGGESPGGQDSHDRRAGARSNSPIVLDKLSLELTGPRGAPSFI
jgi:hypothetical protein